MHLGMQQVQKLSQRLIMTPQMQQSVKLLQMNTMELEALAQQELLENPFLEMEQDDSDGERPTPEDGQGGAEADVLTQGPAEPDEAGAALGDGYETAPDNPGASESAPQTLEREEGSGDVAVNVESNPIENQPEQFSEVDTDWEEVFDDTPSYTYSRPRGEDGDERSMEETVAGATSLYEALQWQLRVSALEGKDVEIGAYLIGCIDERGYMRASLEECAERFDVEVERVERVLKVIQEFDPTGVGARDLPECLLLQLEARGRLTPLADEVLRNHWPQVMKRKLREIARALKVDEAEIREIFSQVQKLNPAPGRAYSKEQPIYITPDVYVRKTGDKYVVSLQEGQVAHLRLSSVYRDLLVRGPGPGQNSKDREYALDKYRSAAMFIKNIERRRNTVLRVTEAIMEHQREFLEKGVEALRPLSLSEIAEKVGLHESTVSRVTSSKYVDTPQGLFELKFFFSSAIESDSGEAASSRSVKRKIQDIIADEDLRRPLSDDKIAKILKDRGFSIARRTVAKYREQLKILPTNLRRQTG